MTIWILTGSSQYHNGRNIPERHSEACGKVVSVSWVLISYSLARILSRLLSLFLFLLDLFSLTLLLGRRLIGLPLQMSSRDFLRKQCTKVSSKSIIKSSPYPWACSWCAPCSRRWRPPSWGWRASRASTWSCPGTAGSTRCHTPGFLRTRWLWGFPVTFGNSSPISSLIAFTLISLSG